LAELRMYNEDFSPVVKIDIGTPEDKETVPEFVKPFEAVKGLIDKINMNAEKIAELRSKSRKEVREDNQKRLMDELDGFIEDTHRIAAEAKSLLQDINVQIEKDERSITKRPSVTMMQVRRNMLATYTMHFQNAMKVYSDENAEFKNNIRDRVGRQAKIVKNDITEAEIDELVSSGNPQQFFKQEMGLSDDLVSTVVAIETRYDVMVRIETSIREMATLFQEMTVLIDVQQMAIDSIEKNANSTKSHAAAAAENIRDAETKGKMSRKVVMWLVCFLLVCIIIVIAVVASRYTYLQQNPPCPAGRVCVPATTTAPPRVTTGF